jgi:hypothetical protein
VEDIDFLMNFVIENSNMELQKLGLEGKISEPSIFHTWANSIGYT